MVKANQTLNIFTDEIESTVHPGDDTDDVDGDNNGDIIGSNNSNGAQGTNVSISN